MASRPLPRPMPHSAAKIDFLESLTTYVPYWTDCLDNLSGKVQQRQIKPARCEAGTKGTDTNRAEEPVRDATPYAEWEMTQLTLCNKKHHAESAAILDGGGTETGIVYYDSDVQALFEDIVTFVSAQRNIIRKAKMAVKVAHIKRMAELDMSPSTSRGAIGSCLQRYKPPADIYDELDKSLVHVQSASEHAAHRFLRDGDCNGEIAKVRQWLAEVLEQAAREMERVKTGGPEDGEGELSANDSAPL